MPVLLELAADRWRLEISGPARELPPFLPAAESELTLQGDAEIRLSEGSGGWGSPDGTRISAQPILFENTSYDCYLVADSDGITLDLPPGAGRLRRSGEFSHYNLSFGNDVGWAELAVRDGSEVVKLRFEVFPSKIDYRTDYAAMRDEVAAMMRGLVMTVQARTFGASAPAPTSRPTLAEWIALLKGYFDQFVRTANAIASNPHSALETALVQVDSGRARTVAERVLERRIRHAPLIDGTTSAFGMRLPRRVPEVRKRTTFNTAENRYVKYLLLETLRKLQRIVASDDTGDEDADLTAERQFFNELRSEARSMIRQIRRLLGAAFLMDIQGRQPTSSSSLSISKHPAYSAFVQTARLLNGGLSLQGGPLRIGIKNIAQLYEYWCFLRLVRMFSESFFLERQSIVQWRHLRFVVVLAKGQESAVWFREGASGMRLCLVYDRLFRGLPTIAQRPDNVIQLASENRLYVLDAKYRLSFDPDYVRRYGGVGPTADDINTMHRYRDAIVIPHPIKRGEFQRGVVQGAVVLFPFADEDGYRGHRFYKSVAEVQIGGIPFLPGAVSLAERHIYGILRADGYFVSDTEERRPDA